MTTHLEFNFAVVGELADPAAACTAVVKSQAGISSALHAGSNPARCTIPEAVAAGQRAQAQVAENAGPDFATAARAFVLNYLRVMGPTSGEDLSDACLAENIVPHSTKAFGPVYAKLRRDGLIEHDSYCLRRRGHGTAGGIVWKLKD